ncbi:Polar localization during asymmetric division and protein [Thalictrum thalictroides]|uniref:Polar localization during asymmetric division and protein n=1 Tax=Thalictrum thalictroides TaxID=46969 RepID=A0A7J6VCG2_THATH|nr:Polar localization during asymmetric division and protein [Thalictrum thalictroides]
MKANDLIHCEGVSRTKEEKGIFKFSSLGRRESKIVRFKVSKSSFVDRNKVILGEDQRKNGRKFSINLTNRTGKIKLRKHRLSTPKGSSFASSGLGVGIMYIASAAKAEIDKLNGAVDEATKVDLKSKLHERKIFCELQDSGHKKHFGTSAEEALVNDKQQVIDVSNVEGANSVYTKVLDPNFTDDEEPSGRKRGISNFNEHNVEHLLEATSSELSSGGLLGPHKVVDRDCYAFLYNGVSPFELERKLCRLLIEQQKSQILELESRLLSAETKLNEKVVELEALKNHVHHIKNLSLQTSSDEETDEETSNVELKIGSDANLRSLIDKETPRRQLIGTKRTIEYEPCDYIAVI